MTRFTLYHTVTDSLGRVTGTIWAIDEQTHRETPRHLKQLLSDVERDIQEYARRKRGGD